MTGQGGTTGDWPSGSSQLHFTKRETEVQREATGLSETTGGQLLNQVAPRPLRAGVGAH